MCDDSVVKKQFITELDKLLASDPSLETKAQRRFLGYQDEQGEYHFSRFNEVEDLRKGIRVVILENAELRTRQTQILNELETERELVLASRRKQETLRQQVVLSAKIVGVCSIRFADFPNSSRPHQPREAERKRAAPERNHSSEGPTFDKRQCHRSSEQ